MENMVMDLSFWKNRKVFITGHTGFKGSWLCSVLLGASADITGYALAPEDSSLFKLARINTNINSVIGDIRDADRLFKAFIDFKPDIVIHMAAQPLVQEGYKTPAVTYETNVMGTVNIMECLRLSDCTQSFVNVTTDKVYQNNEWTWGYREIDILNGYDPYSNSKSCSEMVTQTYQRSFFYDSSVAISTVRAGNVIGGGDFSENRIIPDCARAVAANQPIFIRNPNSVRPYQHVLEPLWAYLLIAQKQFVDKSLGNCYNIGPGNNDCITTGELANIFCRLWGEDVTWKTKSKNEPHEANFLCLDCSRMREVFGWTPKWTIEQAMEKIVEWYKAYYSSGDICRLIDAQIKEYSGVWK